MIVTERHNNGVALITLDRPAARNALSFALLEALREALHAAEDARCVVLASQPLSVAVSFTVYTPALVYDFVGLVNVLVVLSPNSHLYVEFTGVLRLVNCKLVPEQAFTLVKATVGIAIMVTCAES